MEDVAKLLNIGMVDDRIFCSSWYKLNRFRICQSNWTWKQLQADTVLEISERPTQDLQSNNHPETSKTHPETCIVKYNKPLNVKDMEIVHDQSIVFQLTNLSLSSKANLLLKCSVCRKASSSTKVYWAWMLMGCDACINRWTISTYDFNELDWNKSILAGLPCIRKQFPSWGSVSYDFYWAPDVIKAKMHNYQIPNIYEWYLAVNQYRKWILNNELNQKKMEKFLKEELKSTEALNLVCLRLCPSFVRGCQLAELMRKDQFVESFRDSLVVEYTRALTDYKKK